MKVLVIDIGGNNVKILVTGQEEPRRFPSGPTLSAQQMIEGTLQAVEGWEYDVVTIGYPGPVIHGRIATEPVNLGPGWLDFDFEAALHHPVKLINDAAMQALGSYEGGKMLFLGLGTGLGSCLIADRVIVPMELGHLPYRKLTFEDYIGNRGLARLGKKQWRLCVNDVVTRLRAALLPDYIVLGGGNIKKLKELPQNARPGENTHAFLGGFRLWEEGGAKAYASRSGGSETLSR